MATKEQQKDTVEQETATLEQETTEEKAKRTRNQVKLADTLTTLEGIEKDGLPKGIKSLITVAKQLDKDEDWWKRRTLSLIESLKEAQSVLGRFQKVSAELEKVSQ